jgi:hypothetical protein
MKIISKNIVTRIVPQIFIDLLGYVKTLPLLIKSIKWTIKNIRLRNKYFGKDVYILGGGPSLNNFDLSEIYGKNVISMNFFGVHKDKSMFNIVAHCIGEPYPSEGWQDPRTMIESVNSETYWLHSGSIEKTKHIKNKIYYYTPIVRVNSFIFTGQTLHIQGIVYQSTSQMAIAIAMYMGFKKIYLLGMDHDWLVTRGYSPHFYEESEKTTPADLSKFSYTSMIEISLNLFRTYEFLKQVAHNKGVEIYNLSSPSYLDVFPRK